MKKWKILFNIIMETVIFFGIAVLLIIGIPKLMGFFWPFVAGYWHYWQHRCVIF